MSDSLRHCGLQHVRLPCPPFLEFAQIHVHWVADGIQPSYPLLSSSPFAFNLSQHQGLFQWLFTLGDQRIGASDSASVLPVNIQWIFRKVDFPLWLTGLISLLSKGLSRVFSSTTIWNHQFSHAQPSLWSNSHICTLACIKSFLKEQMIFFFLFHKETKLKVKTDEVLFKHY